MRRPGIWDRRRDGGFTLLEIVVALAVLGLSLSVTLQLISGSFTNIARINQYFIASNRAANLMNELMVSPDVKGAMQNAGQFEDGSQWAATVVERLVPPEPNTPESAQPLPLKLLEIQVTVNWQQRLKPHSYVLRSMRVVQVGELGMGMGVGPPGLNNNQPSSRTPGAFVSEPANREKPRTGRSGTGSRRSGVIEP